MIPFARFPRPSPTSAALDRRRFLGVAARAAMRWSLAGDRSAGAPSADADTASHRCPTTRSPTLAVGESPHVVAADGDGEALAVRLDAATVVAFDRRCPHLGCPVRLVGRARPLRVSRATTPRSTPVPGAVLFGPPRRGLTPAIR